MNIRTILENEEKKNLSRYATLSCESRGREHEEPLDDIRTVFSKDRDRIVHSSAFRRLKHKTQVFLSPKGDHYRTRLTHTLEVSQISRAVARALFLNEDLTEAIALGHDLGHTPFGHAGEAALNSIYSGGFKHYEQSVRVCQKVEKDGRGLNLTFETLDGIIHHTGGEEASTLEGRIVRICDKIAYVNHDIDDAVTAGVLSESDLPVEAIECFGDSKSKRIDSMVKSLINNSSDDIRMSDEENKIFFDLHKFMYSEVYNNSLAKQEESKIYGVMEGLYKHFLNNINELPEGYGSIIAEDGPERAVIDYIAGMTDTFALEIYNRVYIPRCWSY